MAAHTLRGADLVNPGQSVARLAIDKDRTVDQGFKVVAIARVFNVQFDCSSDVPIRFTRDNPDGPMDDFSLRE